MAPCTSTTVSGVLAAMGLETTVVLAAVAFLGTNIDNLTLLTAQLATAPANRTRRILSGQVGGFVLVVGGSVLASVALFEVPLAWLGLLGLVPLVLGIRGLLALRDPAARAGRSAWPTAAGTVSALLITVGTSGDNLAVYIPLLRAGSAASNVATVVVFVVLEVGLCLLARWAGRHPATLRFLERGGVYLTPIVYCAIGVVVLVRSGSLSWI